MTETLAGPDSDPGNRGGRPRGLPLQTPRRGHIDRRIKLHSGPREGTDARATCDAPDEKN